jgi:hypothetical protein
MPYTLCMSTTKVSRYSERTCDHCGKTYQHQTIRTWSRYCSGRCGVAAHRKRRRDIENMPVDEIAMNAEHRVALLALREAQTWARTSTTRVNNYKARTKEAARRGRGPERVNQLLENLREAMIDAEKAAQHLKVCQQAEQEAAISHL